MIKIPQSMLQQLPDLARKARRVFSKRKKLLRRKLIGTLKSEEHQFKVYCEEVYGKGDSADLDCRASVLFNTRTMLKEIFIYRHGTTVNLQQAIGHEIVHCLRSDRRSSPSLSVYMNSNAEIEAETASLAQIIGPVLWKDPISRKQFRDWVGGDPFKLVDYYFIEDLISDHVDYWIEHRNKRAMKKLIKAIKIVLQLK